jgi:hypothetical protein
MAAMLASFAAWLFPSFGFLRKGFDSPARLDFNSFAVLSCWYLLVFLSFSVGEKFGQMWVVQRSAPRGNLIDLESNSLYYSFTLLATIGTAATMVRIFQLLSLQQAILYMAIGFQTS